MAIEHINEFDTLNAGREKINKHAIDPANRAELNSIDAKSVANQANQTSQSAEAIAINTDDRLDNIIAGEMQDAEVIDARRPFGGEAYANLGKRLDEQIGKDADFREFEANESFMRRVYNEQSERGINVKSFGIDTSGNVDVTTQLNTILTEFRGRKIFFPDGIYEITNSLILYDNTTIELANNAVIKFKEYALPIRENPNIYVAKHIFKNHPTLGTKNIEVFGGVIDGSARTQARDAHKGFYLENIDTIKIHDIKVKEVSGWGIAHINCKNFHFYNIEFDQAPESEYGFNGDGITGMSSDGLIENISGYTSDDLVSLQAGNTLFSPQSDVRNVTIRGLFPKSKEWMDSSGHKKIEVTHRPIGIYAYDGYSLDNVLVDDVRGVSKHDLLITTPYFQEGKIKGRIGYLSFSNINIEFRGTEPMCCQIKNIDVENIEFNQLVFKDVDGIVQKNAFLIENAVIKKILINGFYCNKSLGDQPFILDKGEIHKFNILNSYFNNDSASGSGHVYSKNTTSIKITELIYTSISGNVGAFVSSSGTNNKIRVINGDYKTQEVFITNPQNGDLVILNDKGPSVYRNNRFFSIGASINVRAVTTPAFLIDDVYSILLIGGGTPIVVFTFNGNVESFNWHFQLSVPNETVATFKNSSGQSLFTGVSITDGVFSIARNGNSWLIAKISEQRYLT